MDNKFHNGNGSDGKHYWLTPPELYADLNKQHQFDFDPCPFPLPPNFDGLTCDWGKSNYVNPPFGSIMHGGKKKGATAWVRKALSELANGKKVVFVYPIDKWVLMLLKAGAKVTNLGDVKWLATEDGSQGKGTGRHIACFQLDPRPADHKESPDTSANTGSPKLPDYKEVESKFVTWWRKEGLSINKLTHRNLKQFYDILVGQLRAGA